MPATHRTRSPRRVVAQVAVATALTASSAAHAAVVTRQVNVTVSADPNAATNSYNLDVNADGTPDFTFTTVIGDTTDPTFASFAQVTTPFASANGEVVDAATADGFPTISLLVAGNTVGPAQAYSSAGDNGNLFEVDAFDPPSGHYNASSGYVGLRFVTGGAVNYGYAYVTVNGLFAPTNPLDLTIGQVGYETVAGQAITLPSAAVPEPVGLAVVATAALGLRRRSRR